MAESVENSGSDKMTITVKTPKEKHDIQIETKATVKELKEQVAAKFSSPIEQLCLIFAGKILKDPDQLEQHGIKDGLTVHLVIKTNTRQPEAAPANPTPTGPAQPDVSQSPFGLGGVGGLPGISGLGMGSANFMEMQQRMQRELMGNPEMMRQMMENPFVQQMMSNPDIMRQLIMNNPQMRDLMERNPEITHMLNNPDLMRQTMELARNPAMLQELMRSQDRAMSNLESLPGGFNALQRMYRDIQEPMMSAAQESLGSNPFASLVNSGSGAGNTQQGRENSDPLPNPWAPNSGSTGTTTAATTTTTTSSSTPSFTSGLLGAQGSMFNSPGMQSLMQQMMQNPQMISNMMQAPYMQSMLQALSTNPELAQQIIGNNPMFAGNPQLMEQFRAQLPTMMQQINNPDVQSTLTNPRAMEAIMQIQQGMQTLQSEAPTLFTGLAGMRGLSTQPQTAPSTATSSSTTTAASPSGDASATTTTTSATATTPTTGTDSAQPTTEGTTATSPSAPAGTTGTGGNPTLAPQMGDQAAFSNMMSQLMGMMVGGQINQPPEQRYASQLEQLAAMGFMDREANIRALTATLGDVNAAIDRLLQQR